MKLLNNLKILVPIIVLLLAAGCCKKGGGGTDPDYPIFSYTSSIVNPPDYFQISYKVDTPGNKTAEVIFEENSVWEIKKLGDSRIVYSVGNALTKIEISVLDTIGFTGGETYTFTANNNLSLELIYYYVQFRKTSDDFETFTPKL